jgi:hypothetical protein
MKNSRNWLETLQDRPRALFLTASLLLLLSSTLAIIGTYDKLSHTIDAPNHLATGMEWLQDGSYIMWTENPPLARAAVALGPFLAGARLPEGEAAQAQRTKDGIEANCGMAGGLGGYLLYETGGYRRTLALARAGTLPYLLLAAAVMWLWLGRERPLAGFLSIATFTTLPAILAHSGLATTDIAFVAMFLLFTWRLVRWLEDSSLPQAAVLGLCVGLAVATKFTSLVFIPAASAALVAGCAWHERAMDQDHRKVWGSRLLQAVLIMAPIAALVLWGAYRFSVGMLSDLPQHLCGWPVYGRDAAGLRGAIANALVEVRLPAPEFIHGVLALLAHNHAGHWAYALGETNLTGFWYFYPLALLVKTPLAFMALNTAGVALAFWRRGKVAWWVPGMYGAILLILLALTQSQVNIGLRHALTVYALGAVVTAAILAGAYGSLEGKWRRVAGTLLGLTLLWQAITSAAAFPNFLTYFNLIAGDDPGEILVDSDLDWGQGVFQLEKFFSEREADVVQIAYFGGARLCQHDLPRLRNLPIGNRVKGWVAISEFYYREAASFLMLEPCGPVVHYLDKPGKGWYTWLEDFEPVAVLGRSIRVYYIE